MSRPSEPLVTLSSVKVVISGGFGVGKTTFIGAISEIGPLDTEAAMTEVSVRVNDTSDLSDKLTTTVDTRRIEDCFLTVEYFEEGSTPFLLAVNRFDGAGQFDIDEIREAVGVGEDIPVVECDARERESVKHTLIALTGRVPATYVAW
ncbi:GTP-binding protein [Amycolatopsis pithecellobii]|uniref:ATP-binding protein n=1 Tax=Amycolatopsis pithecellobii TaxID=664692 RepID=A0A6N7YYE7_9PSEU|nr:ATP-binding protein [Amycolatopsis pithecellobii]MTD52461.1 ATP-binding protein [Amycolatopsis pithecellobii]